MTNPVGDMTAREAMQMLEKLLRDTSLRSFPNAKPIDFDLDGERWSLDPRNKALVVHGSTKTSELVIKTTPNVLVRLLTEPGFALGKGEELAFAGDPNALSPLIEALSGGKKPLNVLLDRHKK